MKAILAIVMLALLASGCGKTDHNKPHEYIEVTGYGEGWSSTEKNARKFDHLSKAQIYAKPGSGKCENYLHSLDPEKIFVEMAATNYLIHSEPESAHDISIQYAKLQCVAYHGQDQNCEQKKKEMLKGLKPESREDAAAIVLLSLASDTCAIKKEIGQARIFSLDDSKHYNFVEY